MIVAQSRTMVCELWQWVSYEGNTPWRNVRFDYFEYLLFIIVRRGQKKEDRVDFVWHESMTKCVVYHAPNNTSEKTDVADHHYNLILRMNRLDRVAPYLCLQGGSFLKQILWRDIAKCNDLALRHLSLGWGSSFLSLQFALETIIQSFLKKRAPVKTENKQQIIRRWVKIGKFAMDLFQLPTETFTTTQMHLKQ